MKQKLQTLKHVLEDVPRFGPAVRSSTEAFESFNAVFRLCSVLSNHQAPSRDIALKMADIDRLKHTISGGYWLQDGQWIRAGIAVREFLERNVAMQAQFGWKAQLIPVPGRVKLPAQAKRRVIDWEKSQAARLGILDATHKPPATSQWCLGLKVTANSGDECGCGSWVFASKSDVSSSHYMCTISILIGRV